MEIPNIWENKKCSKPPTRSNIINYHQISSKITKYIIKSHCWEIPFCHGSLLIENPITIIDAGIHNQFSLMVSNQTIVMHSDIDHGDWVFESPSLRVETSHISTYCSMISHDCHIFLNDFPMVSPLIKMAPLLLLSQTLSGQRSRPADDGPPAQNSVRIW